MKHFRWIIVVLLTPISILALAVIYNSFKFSQFEWGNIPDRVIAFANIVMAASALYAALNAKYWFRQKTHSLGFEKAERLLIQLDTIYASISDDIDKMSLYHLNIKCNNDSDDKNDVNILKYKIENKKNDLNQIKNDLNYLSRWNVKVIDIEYISQVLGKIESNLISSSKAVFNLGSYHSSAVEDTYYRNYFTEGFEKHYTELEESINELDKLYTDFQKTPFDSMFSTR
ncbi:hypothetical protein [Pectobacterium aroidearum]|uniref:hypothetical protein n=1 Tax=Pectobacterium aroidearum TaxID=1201031 RepID=UPI0015E050D2|nr:hypothetical protein [Pectobacterium aroidearum]MBA0205517.1 hypothetical protein [Pectobacterium aroidearum]